jgi:P4 family phage/plasmid primase-like protien
MFKKYKNTVFEKNILPAIPPKAVLSKSSSIMPDQLGKIPGKRNDQGEWFGFVGWTNHQTVQSELDEWASWEANVCLRAGNEYVFIDLDIEDSNLVTQLIEHSLHCLGQAPIRGRTDSNRVMLPYAQAEYIGKQALKFVNTDTGEMIGIDVVGSGGQAAIHGVQAKGGKYVWDINPYDYGSFHGITSNNLEMFLRLAISSCEHYGYKLVSGNTTNAASASYQAEDRVRGTAVDVDALTMLKREVRQLIKQGVPSGEDRSAAVAKVVSALLRLGLEDNQIADVLLNPAYGISERPLEKGEDWTMTDIARMRAKAKPSAQEAQVSQDGDDSFLSEAKILDQISDLDRNSSTEQIEAIIDMIVAIDNKLMQERLLKGLKDQTKLPMSAIRAGFKEAQKTASGDDSDGNDDDEAKSHKELGLQFLQVSSENKEQWVNTLGSMFKTDVMTSMWVRQSPEALLCSVTNLLPKQPNFMRMGDYKAVTGIAEAESHDATFFDSAEHLVVGKDFRVYDVVTGESRPLEINDRIYWHLNATPTLGEPEKWLAFLDRAFEGPHKDSQIGLLQEIFGGSVAGLLAEKQVATMILGPGRTGKTTVVEVLNALFPSELVTSIAPYNWDNEYYLAAMAHSRLNFITDIDSERKIPSGIFKMVMDRTQVTAREPGGKPFYFVNKAAQIVVGNELPFSGDESEAFMRRWVGVLMENVIAEDEVDSQFARKIIASELGQILSWALEGAKRIIERGRLVSCPVSNKIKHKWSSESNSAMLFLSDEDVLESNFACKIHFSDLFIIYKAWCKYTGYRAFGKKKFYEIARNNYEVYERNRSYYLVRFTIADEVFSLLGLYKADLRGVTIWDDMKKAGPE